MLVKQSKFHEDKMSVRDIRETIDRILRKAESEGGFVDDSSIANAKEWAEEFIQDLKEYFDDEDAYNGRSSSEIWINLSLTIERLKDSYDELDIRTLDPKKYNKMERYYKRSWDNESSFDGYRSYEHRSALEEHLHF
eukprot:scaffold1345_cov173-Ochromonas_danica.AAC.9